MSREDVEYLKPYLTNTSYHNNRKEHKVKHEILMLGKTNNLSSYIDRTAIYITSKILK